MMFRWPNKEEGLGEPMTADDAVEEYQVVVVIIIVIFSIIFVFVCFLLLSSFSMLLFCFYLVCIINIVLS